jgi:hypothetical protein
MRKVVGWSMAFVCAMFIVAAPAWASDHGRGRDGHHARYDGDHGRHRFDRRHHRFHPAPATPNPTGQACDPIDPSLCMLPFPDNFFTRADRHSPTGLRLDISPSATPLNVAGQPIDPTDWNRLDGFSPGSPIVTHVPGMDNPQAFANTDAPTNIDIQRSLERSSPIVVIDATTGRRWPVWAELDRSLDLKGNMPTPAQTALLIHPAVNLAEGHRYIVALRDLRDADGNVIPAQAPFASLLSGHGRPSDQKRYFDHAIFPQLQRAGIDPRSLYLAWDFTVASRQSLTDTILFMRDDALAKLGDTRPGDGVVQGHAPSFTIDSCTVSVSPAPAGCTTSTSLDSRVYAHVAGHVTVPCYLNVTGCPPGSRFNYSSPDATLPTPIPGNTISANFECNIPIGATTGQTFQPVLNGHGLFGTADQVNSDELFALAPFRLMACATDEIGMAQSDVPNAITSLQNLSGFPSIPDRLQQGMIDFLYLGRDLINPGGFCSSPIFQVNGKCVIDTSHLFYDGGSQGAIFGGALAAIDPDFTRAALNVAGMDYGLLLTRSSDFPEFAQFFYAAYPDPLERSMLFSLEEDLWDHGETDGYAEHITSDPLPDTPRHSILMTVGFGDHQVTNWASEIEARTIGAQLREPVLDPGRYPGPTPYWGIPRIRSFPFNGPAAMVVGDLGPLRACPNDGVTVCAGAFAGTPPPPLENVANTAGVDPHGPDWATTTEGEAAIGQWLQPHGFLPAVCDDHPCYMAGYNGPGS